MADPLFCHGDSQPLPIPDMDHLFLSNSPPDLGFPLDDTADFHLTFDGLDDLDDLYFPSESEPFLIPDSASPQGELAHSAATSAVNAFLNCSSPESGSCDRPVSSQGSGVSQSVNDSGNVVVDQKIKVEETGKARVLKRKKEDDGVNVFCKTKNSSSPSESACVTLSEEEEKRRSRLMRNRESAQLSRQRKKHYVEELEDKVRTMHSTIAELNNKIAYFMAENATLRQQVGGPSAAGAGLCPPPPMYAPMAYPWVPCPPYVVKPQGSQVPLVPIPRLKPQQPAPAAKPKKTDSKKSQGKVSKVASISFLGLFFFMFLFGGLLPIMNVRYGEIGDTVSGGLASVSDGLNVRNKGRVMIVSDRSNTSDDTRDVGFSYGKLNHLHGRDRGGRSEFGSESKGRAMSGMTGSDEHAHSGNGSEPLVASLYVPRNDKLVKIDGNLIIHSVLASERAVASHEIKGKRETGLAIPIDFPPALAIPDARGNGERHPHSYRNHAERLKALSSGSTDALKDHLKSSAADGKMQQWFREGVAGPMLSSGMCTEVFQFDVSPKPGAIVPASSVSNVSAECHRNDTQGHKGRNRRILHGPPVPLSGSDLNITGQHTGGNSKKENLQASKASSVVVSVLIDPREASDVEMDGVITSKSLSRIFVVVLLDSVKYVTYSCMLPRSGSHLVTT